LKSYLAGHGSEPVEQVVAGLQEAVRVFSSGAAQGDDITALALRFTPA
jgi:serine phosphatase RsbU (regulator of sigma subunit)